MGEEVNPNEARFAEIESALERLINSQRQLLHAQVIMADGQSRTEKNLEKLTEITTTLAAQVQKIADGQKHSDERIDALADIVRQIIERNGKNAH